MGIFLPYNSDSHSATLRVAVIPDLIGNPEESEPSQFCMDSRLRGNDPVGLRRLTCLPFCILAPDFWI